MVDRHSEDPPGLICLGAVTGARGLKGELRIKCLAEDPRTLVDHGPLQSADGTRAFVLTLTGSHKGQLLGRIDGVTDRDKADALKGTRLYLPRAALPEPEEDEFYYSDLEGLKAELPDGTALGTVRWAFDFGAGDVLEITGVDGKPLMVPFTKAVVPTVDLAGGKLVVDPPPGLLEEPEKDE
ncbi:ribosome maturation factor RimM [Magnetospira sp. QH-2]|uniref:ribosome maturation factor RimM n=1 Tax=Magnetospira sp. (strain QH-2) TaxID=1288970 RepID=UPI0003E80D6C|nr:ribosome maturation factor RimM [Magnetospira sp. QH-2]CCQ72565.1 Ribosome maturation factor rimM [Magnetospira sp. QH-2]